MERKLQNDRARQIELMEHAEERAVGHFRSWIAQHPHVKSALQGMSCDGSGYRRETKRIRVG